MFASSGGAVTAFELVATWPSDVSTLVAHEPPLIAVLPDAEAADRAFADGEESFRAVVDGARDPLAAFVDWYVSADHRDNAAVGCPVVALGDDVRRCDERVRAAYRRQVERYLVELERLLGGEDARRRATVALSTLVGSIMLARAVDDEELSDEILRDVRAALKS
jgi:TetR/AcrR family transcriptional repressor of nem operon